MILPRLVIITGQFRSGTSAVAQVVNRLGVPVAVTLGCPHVFSAYEFDWEDPETFRVLSRWRPLDGREIKDHGFVRAIRTDLERRMLVATRLAEESGIEPPKVIASKCPLWALAIDELFKAAAGIFGKVTLIRTERIPKYVELSVDRIYRPGMREQVHAMNGRIGERVDLMSKAGTWDLCVPYGDLVYDPAEWTRRIALALDVPYCVEASAIVRKDPVCHV